MMVEDMAKTSSMPPIKKLFQDSWKTFTKSILPLFLFVLTMIGLTLLFWIVVVAVGVVLIMATGISAQISLGGITALSSVQLPIYLLFGVYLLATLVGLVILSSIGNIVPVMIVDKFGSPISISSKIKSSVGLIIPLFLTGILTSLLTVGSVFLFVFPAIFFSFFLMFVNFEVILNGKKYTAALKRSAFIVSKNFGDLLVRVILYVLLWLLIAIFIPNLIAKVEPQTGIFIRILSVLVNTLLGWFGLCFSVTLYKQARAGLDKQTGRIAWMWVVSLVGWLIFFVIIFAGFRALTSAPAKTFFQNLEKEDSSSFMNMINGTKNQYTPQNNLEEL